jgi:hypothetical protein
VDLRSCSHAEKHLAGESVRLETVQRWIVNQVISLGDGIAQMSVLRQMRFNNTRDSMAYGSVLGNKLQCPMFYLLEEIWFPVGVMDIHRTRSLIDARLISLGTEGFPGLNHAENGRVVRLRPEIKITRIEPPPYI